ncbi:MAG TPA: enoyl-ACP reductase [Armatimonadota bacterium]|jgi:enoyl-[acyl-carrier protein] reductase I
MSGLLAGKTALVMGVRNKWSIAWAIANAYVQHGAQLVLTYQGEREERAVRGLGEDLGASLVLPCDVSDSSQVQGLFERIGEEYGTLDAYVHAVAFARKEDLSGMFADTPRDHYLLAQEISVFSFVECVRYAAPLMKNGGSAMTLTYLGAERAIPNYNVMGVAKAALEASMRYLSADLGKADIRVNAISAGPIKTLSAKGISDFDEMLRIFVSRAPIPRIVEQDEVAGVAVFLASDLSKCVSGEVIHADNGYHIVGL